jgi:hypothetical protein
VLIGSAVLLLGAAVVGLQAWQARHDLVQARSSIERARQAVSDGDQARARDLLSQARAQSHRAQGRVTGWVWSAYGHLPASGAPTREARGLIEVTDAVTSQVLGPLVSSAPSSTSWTGQADLAAVRRTAGPLGTADARLTQVRARLAGLPVSHVRQLDRARADLSRSVAALAVDLRDAAVAARVLPALLGGDHPTHLLLVAQNQAEERATGGLIGAYALLSAKDGRLTLLRSGADTDLVDAAHPVVDLGADFTARYGVAQATSTWRSANLTPDLPSAGAILAGLSARQLGQAVDGVVLVDPVALAHVLGATGPVDVPGLGAMSGDNAVALLLKDAYARYASASDQAVRKEVLRNALDRVVLRLQQPVSGQLARQLASAAASGHLQAYATDAALEGELRRSRVGGALPDSGPFLFVVTQDVGGSKLDYYLHRAVEYDASASSVAVDLGVGPETVEDGTVTVRLRNDAPASGLPAYVTTRADDPRARRVGQLKTWVSIYLGPRSTYTKATLDGRPVSLSTGVEGGLSVFSTFLTVDPGQSVTLQISVEQPAGPGSVLLWRQQPRLEPDALVVRRPGGYAVAYDTE